jgi:hypothetical protein
LVFKCLHAHGMCMSASIRSHLHLLFSKMGVLEQHCHARAWIIDLRRCTKLFGVHHWKSSGRNRLTWHFVRKHCFDGLYYPTSPTARIPGCHGCCDYDFVNCWSTHRRSFHDEIDLEMVCASDSACLLKFTINLAQVFLHQSACRRAYNPPHRVVPGN